MSEAARSELETAERGASGRERDALAVLSRKVSAARSLDDVMALVAHSVRELLHADGATFVLRDGDRCYYAEEDAVSPLWKGRRFPMSACISGWSMTHREPLAIADIYKDDRIPADAYRPTFVKSLAMAPVGRETPVAALGAYWAERRQPSPAELELLCAIADAAALGVVPPGPSLPAPARPPAPVDAGRDRVTGVLRRLRRGALRPNTFEAYAFAALCVLLSTLAREAVRATGVENLAIFSTYYPAVLIAVLVGGLRAGALAAGLGALAAYSLFMPSLHAVTPVTIADALNLSLYGGASALIILIIDWYQRAVLRLRAEDVEHMTLAREQRHRVRNALVVMQTIVNQSLRDDPERARSINKRVRSALSDVDFGDAGGQTAVSLRELLSSELQAYDLDRISLQGEDDAPLPPRVRRLLSLAAHELATNAAKYGALSVPAGRITVAWRLAEGRASMIWTEADGPLVRPPQRLGFGSMMLRRLSESAGGQVSVDYRPSGVHAEISLPLQERQR